MDGADAMAPAGWSLIRGYFSPATLFLLVNVVIGTIALTSRSHRRHHHHDEHYKAQDQQEHEPQRYGHDQYAPPPPAQLARTSSVMERLRSLGLYRFRSGDFPPEYNLSATNAICDESEKQQAQYTRSRSEPAARPSPVEQKRKEENAGANKVKTVKKSTSEAKKLECAPAAQARQVQRAPPRAPARALHVAREEIQEVEAAAGSSVDARADDFINKFRQQLQLQRLNSLLNYKEMLNHGT